MFKILKEKSGSYLVEASLIYPIIVFAAVLSIAVSAGMFIDVLNVSEMESAARRAADDKSGTVIYNDMQDNAGHEVFEYELPGYMASGDIIRESGTDAARYSVSGAFEYKNNSMFNIFSENKYVLYHSAVNEASVLWQRQAEENY